MINYEDQMNIFRLISNNLESNVTCYTFGGTAMMFYGYKDETKDIDVVFESEKSRDLFIKAIEKLGFEETSPITIYIPEKLKDKSKPLMYRRDDFRMDLFANKIFRTKVSEKMKDDVYAVHEFKGKKNLTVKVVRKEQIVLLKAVTERVNDFDDIKTIISKEKHFDFQYVIDEAIWQHKNGDSWILLDMKITLRELQKYIPVQNKYIKQLHEGK